VEKNILFTVCNPYTNTCLATEKIASSNRAKKEISAKMSGDNGETYYPRVSRKDKIKLNKKKKKLQ